MKGRGTGNDVSKPRILTLDKNITKIKYKHTHTIYINI